MPGSDYKHYVFAMSLVIVELGGRMVQVEEMRLRFAVAAAAAL